MAKFTPRFPEKMNRVRRTAISKGAEHESVWIGMPVAPEYADALAVAGGEAPEDLHCTLVMVAESASELDADLLAMLPGIVQLWANGHVPITGEIAGPGSFTAGEKPVAVALVDAFSLSAAREDLVERLRRAGLPIVTEHGYTPHITLAYDERTDHAPSGPIGFSKVSLGIGGEYHDYLIGGNFDISKRATRDGDGDGFIFDGTPMQRSALPNLELPDGLATNLDDARAKYDMPTRSRALANAKAGKVAADDHESWQAAFTHLADKKDREGFENLLLKKVDADKKKYPEAANQTISAIAFEMWHDADMGATKGDEKPGLDGKAKPDAVAKPKVDVPDANLDGKGTKNTNASEGADLSGTGNSPDEFDGWGADEEAIADYKSDDDDDDWSDADAEFDARAGAAAPKKAEPKKPAPKKAEPKTVAAPSHQKTAADVRAEAQAQEAERRADEQAKRDAIRARSKEAKATREAKPEPTPEVKPEPAPEAAPEAPAPDAPVLADLLDEAKTGKVTRKQYNSMLASATSAEDHDAIESVRQQMIADGMTRQTANDWRAAANVARTRDSIDVIPAGKAGRKAKPKPDATPEPAPEAAPDAVDAPEAPKVIAPDPSASRSDQVLDETRFLDSKAKSARLRSMVDEAQTDEELDAIVDATESSDGLSKATIASITRQADARKKALATPAPEADEAPEVAVDAPETPAKVARKRADDRKAKETPTPETEVVAVPEVPEAAPEAPEPVAEVAPEKPTTRGRRPKAAPKAEKPAPVVPVTPDEWDALPTAVKTKSILAATEKATTREQLDALRERARNSGASQSTVDNRVRAINAKAKSLDLDLRDEDLSPYNVNRDKALRLNGDVETADRIKAIHDEKTAAEKAVRVKAAEDRKAQVKAEKDAEQQAAREATEAAQAAQAEADAVWAEAVSDPEFVEGLTEALDELNPGGDNTIDPTAPFVPLDGRNPWAERFDAPTDPRDPWKNKGFEAPVPGIEVERDRDEAAADERTDHVQRMQERTLTLRDWFRERLEQRLNRMQQKQAAFGRARNGADPTGNFSATQSDLDMLDDTLVALRRRLATTKTRSDTGGIHAKARVKMQEQIRLYTVERARIKKEMRGDATGREKAVSAADQAQTIRGFQADINRSDPTGTFEATTASLLQINKVLNALRLENAQIGALPTRTEAATKRKGANGLLAERLRQERDRIKAEIAAAKGKK